MARSVPPLTLLFLVVLGACASTVAPTASSALAPRLDSAAMQIAMLQERIAKVEMVLQAGDVDPQSAERYRVELERMRALLAGLDAEAAALAVAVAAAPAEEGSIGMMGALGSAAAPVAAPSRATLTKTKSVGAAAPVPAGDSLFDVAAAPPPAVAPAWTCQQVAAQVVQLLAIHGPQAALKQQDIPRLVAGCERTGNLTSQAHTADCLMRAKHLEAARASCDLDGLVKPWL